MSLDSKSWRKQLRRPFASFQQEVFPAAIYATRNVGTQTHHFFFARPQLKPLRARYVASKHRRRLSDSAAKRLPAIYWAAQLTWLFQSTNGPWGFSRHAQTCSSKNGGRPYRFGPST